MGQCSLSYASQSRLGMGKVSRAKRRQHCGAERAALREYRRLNSCRKLLRYAQIKKIIMMKFGEIGGVERTDVPYKVIASRVNAGLRTVISAYRYYEQRGHQLRPPDFRARQGRRKLKPHIIKWVTSKSTLWRQRSMGLHDRCKDLVRLGRQN